MSAKRVYAAFDELLALVRFSNDVQFTWSAATDDTTPEEALTYNLRVGTTPGGIDIVSPMADPVTGVRHIHARGNAGAVESFTLRGLQSGQTYYWSVQAIDNSFAGGVWTPERSFVHLVSVGTEAEQPPASFALEANYPNPFADQTTMRYTLPEASEVELVVYDAMGKEVGVLAKGMMTAGARAVEWSSAGLASGLYLLRLRAAGQSASRQVLLVR